MRSRLHAYGSRWLGIGLAAVIAVITLGLAAAGQLALYISPESAWFACAAAVVTLAGAVWSFTLPLGAETEHGHDHSPGDSAHSDSGHGDAPHGGAAGPRRRLAGAATLAGGAVASAVVLAALVLPPASLSAQLAMSRANEETTLFAGADTVALGVADTATFGIGEWASVFATATRPETYDGASVTLTGFLTPAGSDPDEARLTRMVITHCVIDAQPAGVAVAVPQWSDEYEVGEWVEVKGTVRADADGALSIVPESVSAINEPGDPYEY